MERYFESLLTMGSAAGVHIQAKSILRKAGIDYNRALDCKSEAACEKALKLWRANSMNMLSAIMPRASICALT